MKAPTSARIAAERASAAAIGLGCTLLESRLMAHVAGRGSTCWETDGQVRDQIESSTGRRYHRESVGRARRHLRDRGVLASVRLYMGQRPKGARFPTSHGTTEKRVLWSRLGLRDPRGRAERRRARDEQPQPRRIGPRYVEFAPTPPAPALVRSEVVELARAAISAMGDDDSSSSERVSLELEYEARGPPE